MKRIIYLLSLVLLAHLSSCIEYQFVSLQSELPQGYRQSFVKETDSLRISYYFSGLNCPVTIEVYNKLNIPIFVDWKRSSMIINQEKVALWVDENIYNSVSEGFNRHFNPRFNNSPQFSKGFVKREKSIKMIPPKSFVAISPLYIQGSFFELPKDLKSEKLISKNGTPSLAKKYTFSQENSPLYFRSYIAISGSDDFSNTTFQDDAFWVSEIVQTSSKFLKAEFSEENQFLLQKEDTETATTLAIVVGLVVLLGSSGN